ncbi:MAG: hypothetical protein WCA45_17035, partial [Thiobacillaceae bacterium]
MYHAPITQTPILHHTPVVVRLAVFNALIASQKHESIVETLAPSANGQGLHYTRLLRLAPLPVKYLRHGSTRKLPISGTNGESRVSAPCRAQPEKNRLQAGFLLNDTCTYSCAASVNAVIKVFRDPWP